MREELHGEAENARTKQRLDSLQLAVSQQTRDTTLSDEHRAPRGHLSAIELQEQVNNTVVCDTGLVLSREYFVRTSLQHPFQSEGGIEREEG
jgi:hypothetical protein